MIEIGCETNKESVNKQPLQDYNIRSSSGNGLARRKCESNGRWSRDEIACDIIECPVPRAPAGGRVSGYDRTIRAEIEFSCLTGHVLVGAEVLSCAKEGRWAATSATVQPSRSGGGPFPSCKFVDCGQLPKLDGGTVSYVNGSTHLGSVARYSCHRSHALAEGDSERACLASGEWSGLPPSCSEIRCHLPTRPNNTVISVSR